MLSPRIQKQVRVVSVLVVIFSICTLYSWLTNTRWIPGYGRTLVLDSFDVFSQASEQGHKYSVTNQTFAGRNYFCSEGYDVRACGSALVAEDGRANRGIETFRMRANPGRDLLLVRRIDAYSKDQSVEVSVDQRIVGIWKLDADTLPPNQHGVRDLVFRVPSSFISSSEPSFIMRFVSGSPDVNSFHYWSCTSEGIVMALLQRSFVIFAGLIFCLGAIFELRRRFAGSSAGLWSILSALLVAIAISALVGILFGLVYLVVYFGAEYASRLADSARKHPIKWFLPLAVFILGALGPSLVMDRVTHKLPLESDDWSYIYQSRLFASARINGPTISNPAVSGANQIHDDGIRRISRYPPGHSLVLAIGSALGSPWLIPPLVMGASAMTVYFIGYVVGGLSLALTAALLLVVSPMFILMGGTTYSHTTSSFFLTLFTFLYIVRPSRERNTSGLWAGFALGFAFVTRPFTSVLYAFPFGIHGIFVLLASLGRGSSAGEFKGLLRRYGAMALAFAIAVGVQMGYNKIQTGNPFLYGFNLVWGGDQVSFDLHASCGDGISLSCLENTLLESWSKSSHRIDVLIEKFVGWPWIPHLLFIFVLFATGSARVFDVVLAGSVVSQIAGYSFYWYPGACWIGPIYYYETVVPLILLTARGMLATLRLVRAIPQMMPLERTYRGLFVTLGLSSLLGLFSDPWEGCFTPQRKAFCNVSELSSEMKNRYRVNELLAARKTARAVVFLRWWPPSQWNTVYYTSQNAPDLGGPVVYAIDQGDQINWGVHASMFSDRECLVLVHDNGGTLVPCK